MAKKKRKRKAVSKKFIPQASIVSDELYIPNHSGNLDAGTFALTDGSVLFAEDLKIAQDNSNLFWDNVNKRLGIGTASPEKALDVDGNVIMRGGSAILGDGTNAAATYDFTTNGVGTRQFRFYSGAAESANRRWFWRINNDAESGSNAGSNLVIMSRDDSGAALGNEVFAITRATGNVGIGTASPLVKLDVAGSSGGDSMIRVINTGNNFGPRMWVEDDNDGVIAIPDSTGTDKVGLYSNASSYFNGGNVGIGTTNPSHKLHLSDATNPSVVLTDTTNTCEARMQAGNGDVWMGSKSNHDFHLLVNDAEKLTILTNDNVGIGTNSPNDLLEIKKSSQGANPIGLRIVGDRPTIRFKEEDGSANENWQVEGSAGRFIIGINNDAFGAFSEKLTIKQDGNVGIGITSPSEQLHLYRNNADTGASLLIEQDDTGDAALRFLLTGVQGYTVGIDNSVTGNPLIFSTSTTFASGNHMAITTGGNIGIGTVTPTQPLSVKEKSCMTAIGGFAIKLTNKTGANSIAGGLVKADTANNDAVIACATSDVECFGVFLDSGVSDGSETWIVVSGIADVIFENNHGPTRGDWVATSGLNAGAAVSQASPAAAPTHFEEIGHCIETVAAGGPGIFVKARCVLHFN